MHDVNLELLLCNQKVGEPHPQAPENTSNSLTIRWVLCYVKTLIELLRGTALKQYQEVAGHRGFDPPIEQHIQLYV